MNPPPDDDQLLGRWLDNELTPAERTRFESMLAAEPALREEAESMKKLGDTLRANVKFERESPHADFHARSRATLNATRPSTASEHTSARDLRRSDIPSSDIPILRL